MMSKEEQQFIHRLIELSGKAYQRGIGTYSDFLDLNELNILYSIPKDQLYTSFQLWGGYDLSERQMVAFIPDALCCNLNYPMIPLEIRASNRKFAEELTHRDYLGAILNLGITRIKIGDILVTDSSSAIVFVQKSIADYIGKELSKVRHTMVSVSASSPEDISYSPRFEEIRGTVASLRLDSLLSIAFSASRTKLTALIEAGRVFVNGRLITSNGYQIKEGDIISVRKMGKFKYIESLSKTKKNRTFVLIHKYI